MNNINELEKNVKNVKEHAKKLENQVLNCTTMPLIVHEMSETRHEKREKRFLLVIALLIAILAGSNMAWLYVFQSYDYTSTSETVTLDSLDGGNANYIGNDGDINNGEGKGDEKNEK